MTSSGTDLDEIETAYRRVSLAIYRALEDAYDFAVETIIDALERDQRIVNAAFFVLIFGQLERQIGMLTAAASVPSPSLRGRSRSFRSRLAAALPGRDERSRRREIEQWYELRNSAAHGETIGASYNIRAILVRARELQARFAVVG